MQSPEIQLLNVDKVWRKGITGKGIVVAVVDDGVAEDHNDLKDNYVSFTRIDILASENHGNSDPFCYKITQPMFTLDNKLFDKSV